MLAQPALEPDKSVINGRPRDVGAIAYIDGLLRRARPEIIVIGNSTAETDISLEQLGAELDVDPERIVTIALPNSIASHWYAILDHRVFQQGVHVPLVLVVSPVPGLLAVEPYTESSRNDLLVHLKEREPVLDQFVHRYPRIIEHLRQRRLAFRKRFLDNVRDDSASLLFDLDMDEVAQRVFHFNRLGGVEVDGEHDVNTAAVSLVVPRPKRGLLIPLMNLAKAYGTRIAFVCPPEAPGQFNARELQVPDDVVGKVASMVRDGGHTWIDLSREPLPTRWFDNARHLSREGAKHVTSRAGPELRRAVQAGPPPLP